MRDRERGDTRRAAAVAGAMESALERGQDYLSCDDSEARATFAHLGFRANLLIFDLQRDAPSGSERTQERRDTAFAQMLVSLESLKLFDTAGRMKAQIRADTRSFADAERSNAAARGAFERAASAHHP